MKQLLLTIIIILFQLIWGYTNMVYAQANKLITVIGNNNKLQIAEKGNINNIQLTFLLKKSNSGQEKIFNTLRDSLNNSFNLKLNYCNSKIDSLNLKVDSLKLFISKQNYTIQARVDSISSLILNEKIKLRDTITMLQEKYNGQTMLIEKLKKIVQEDKATWTYSFIPGLRQYKLGYKANAYIYWSAYGGSFVSLIMAQKYNSDYRKNKRNFDQTNAPDEQDHHFNAMNLAKQRRNNCYTASAWIAGGTYLINLIDALFIKTRRKVFPDNLSLSPALMGQCAGIHVACTFK